jgi:hypothetical protein
LGLDFNPGPPKYEAGVFTTQTQCSVYGQEDELTILFLTLIWSCPYLYTFHIERKKRYTRIPTDIICPLNNLCFGMYLFKSLSLT